MVGLWCVAPSIALASFHLWDIQEVYTNADGTVQFVEFFTTVAGQDNLFPDHMLASTGAVTSAFPNDLPNSSTANKTFLVGTSNLGTLYGVTPDYVIPANFLTSGAGNVLDFAGGTDVVNLTSLPTDGVTSLDGLVNNATPASVAFNAQATPTNFAGQSATIPEPATSVLFLAAAGVYCLTRRGLSRGEVS